jgi:hypothetical protein
MVFFFFIDEGMIEEVFQIVMVQAALWRRGGVISREYFHSSDFLGE